jgi:hypothetical protein
MRATPVAAILLLAASSPSAFSQVRVHSRNLYERLLCVVPMVGAGTPDDPRRPMYAPLPARGAEPSQDGIIAFSFQESDDGRYAIVEFVARDRAAFREILQDRRAEVKVFDKGTARRSDIETEFRKHKRDFDLDDLAVGAL